MDFLNVLSITKVRIPVNDEPGVNLYSYFDFVADLIYENTLKHIKTLVHCKAGVSRSASLCIAYLIKYHRYLLLFVKCVVCM